jgi:3D (Asp-Asp-Asp) domain-containing protein
VTNYVTSLDTPQATQRVMEVTWYTSSEPECSKHDGITASGTEATEGRTVAMGPSYPFGTRVVIDGHEYTVEDRGGGIGDQCVDVFTGSQSRALEHGRQWKTVEIKED